MTITTIDDNVKRCTEELMKILKMPNLKNLKSEIQIGFKSEERGFREGDTIDKSDIGILYLTNKGLVEKQGVRTYFLEGYPNPDAEPPQEHPPYEDKFTIVQDMPNIEHAVRKYSISLDEINNILLNLK